MPEKMILWLERRLPASYRPFIGPKAASLCTLRGLGVKVPPGFCVTTSAFRKHLDANGLRPQIAARLDRTPPAIEEIRQLMTGAPLMDLLHEQIAASYAQLGAGTVAVRSSATAEDLPGHSFAGQYETVLGVTSLEGCLEAVKECWASLWTERAFEYRGRNGIEHQQVGVTRQTIIAIEAGKYAPSLPLAFRIARAFNATVEDVFQYDSDSERPDAGAVSAG